MSGRLYLNCDQSVVYHDYRAGEYESFGEDNSWGPRDTRESGPVILLPGLRRLEPRRPYVEGRNALLDPTALGLRCISRPTGSGESTSLYFGRLKSGA